MTQSAPDIEALLAHAGWIRSLARNLVSDASRADDLVQQTWVAALEHPPSRATPLKRWLSAVLRNFARQDRRGERRRGERETAVARPEAIPSTRESLEAIAVQRALFEAVVGLDEPYRSTIFERFYEGLPPREIARRHGLPVKTVKTRLSRGLERLRAELDRRNGGRRELWLPALLPLAGWPGIPASTLGAFIVDTKLKIAAAVVLVGATALVWNLTSRSDPQRAEIPRTAQPEPAVLSRTGETPAFVAALLPEQTRESAGLAPKESTPPSSPSATIAAAPVAHGRVVDLLGRAIGGVGLRWSHAKDEAPFATSAPDGSFRIDVSYGEGALVACGLEFSTLFGAEMHATHTAGDLVVVVAPRGGLSGIVVDAEGRPVPGAEVQMRCDREVLRGLELITDASREVRRGVRTDADGRFEMLDAPATDRARLRVLAPGFEEWGSPAPDRAVYDLRIVLHRDERPVLRGEVLDLLGARVEGAWVACGGWSTRTDSEGRFALELGEGERVTHRQDQWPSEGILLALKSGHLPARLEKPADGWPDSIRLRLSGEPLEIRGRVVDPQGKGIVGILVRTLDEGEFGTVVESIGGSGEERTIESLLGDRGVDGRVECDAEGRFVVRGLLDRSYRLGFLDKETLRAIRIDPVPAGTSDLHVVMPGTESFVRVGGRVVTTSGKPVPAVRVTAVREVSGSGAGAESWSEWGPTASVDEQGRFQLGMLPPDGIWFQVGGADIDLLFRWQPPRGMALDELEIPVSLRCHLQIDLGDRPGLADSFQVLDGNGSPLTLSRWAGSGCFVGDSQPITRGRSDVVAVPETGRTVVLNVHGSEILRQPVHLVPGEIAFVRP